MHYNLVIFGIILANLSFSVPSGAITPRILGGRSVPKDEYVPYLVSLQIREVTGRYIHKCGGSILSPNRILTAAHCLFDIGLLQMFVLAGVRDLRATDGQRSQVRTFAVHKGYVPPATNNDIAILYIDPPLQLDGVRVASIRVNDSTPVGGGVPVTLSGWGLRLPLLLPFLPASLKTVHSPNVMKTLTYHTITNEQCKVYAPSEVQLCARGFLKSSCAGDSGGPLAMKTETGLLQVGIVSFGSFICGLPVPDGFTRVSKYTDWIQAHL